MENSRGFLKEPKGGYHIIYWAPKGNGSKNQRDASLL